MTALLKTIPAFLILLASQGAFAIVEDVADLGLPPSCSLVFQTEAEASAHCEKNSYAVPVKDLWNNMVVGFSCYCPGHSTVLPPNSETARR